MVWNLKRFFFSFPRGTTTKAIFFEKLFLICAKIKLAYFVQNSMLILTIYVFLKNIGGWKMALPPLILSKVLPLRYNLFFSRCIFLFHLKSSYFSIKISWFDWGIVDLMKILWPMKMQKGRISGGKAIFHPLIFFKKKYMVRISSKFWTK